jgi:hypothetical protein
MIRRLTLDPPAWNLGEILRYARAKDDDEALCALIDECCQEAAPHLTYPVCYTVEEILRQGDEISFGTIRTNSNTLKKALVGCDRVLLFAATIGTPFDRLIQKYSRVSPSKALILQAIGAERVEALCDAFQSYYKQEHHVHLLPRVSPGYGDMPLVMQRDVFMMLDCPRKIGLTLNEALLMSPSKSVTAFAGITNCPADEATERCASCDQTDCQYRNS